MTVQQFSNIEEHFCSGGDEVDTETIFEIKGLTNRSYILMDDMPTIGECLDHYGEKKFYVQSGFDRFKSESWVSGMPTSDFDKYFESTLDSYRVTPIISDPSNVDSDGDGYWDIKDDLKLFDSLLYTELSHKYVSVKYDGKEIWDRLDNPAVYDESYGGNQNWFYDSSNGESLVAKGYYIEKHGCGLISATDILLYLNSYYGIMSESSRVFNDISKSETIPFGAYIYDVECLEKDFFTVTPLGVNGLSIAKGISDASFGKLRTKWGISSNNKLDFLTQIEDMINDDIPVCLSISFDSDEVGFYNRTVSNDGDGPYKYSKTDDCKGHYVTVTGVFVDLQTRKTWLKISTWGEELYLDFDSYYLNVNFLTNILFIERI